MKKGKRILSLFLVVVLLLSLSPVSFANGNAETGQGSDPVAQEATGSGNQPQSGGTLAENTLSASAAAASGDAGAERQAGQPAAAAENAAEQGTASQASGNDVNKETVSSAVAADSEPEGAVEAPKTEKTAESPAAEATGDTSQKETSGEAAGTEQADDVQKAGADSGTPEKDNTLETTKTEPSDEKPDAEVSAKKEKAETTVNETPEITDPADEKAAASDAPVAEKAAVRSVAAHSMTSAKGVSEPPAQTESGDYYSLNLTEGDVHGVNDTEKDKENNDIEIFRVIDNGSVEIELAGDDKTSNKPIVFGDDDSTKTYNIVATLKNVVISTEKALAGILVKANTTLKLLLGTGTTNDVTGGPDHAGIEVEWKTKTGDDGTKTVQYASLTIDGEGTLNATGGSGSGGAGIGGSKGEQGVYGDITINGGTINATGTSDGAGIGSSQNPKGGTSSGSWKYTEEQWGKITINGGTVTATGNGFGAGIGGGNHSDSGEIVINDGTVTATGHTGIGSGYGSHKTAVNSETGKYQKGPGYYYADITINGGTVTATASQGGTTNDGGAGIGGGQYADAKVTITGGTVTATGGSGRGIDSSHHGGAGIGGGYEGHSEVTITGGTVAASGGGAAAGIGSGPIPNTNEKNTEGGEYKSRRGDPTYEKTTVAISGGDVTATGGVSGGAGIGGGVGADNVSVEITGGNVTATGGLSSEGKKRGGAGIGSGYSGLTSGESSKYFTSTDVEVAIGGKADVTATGGWGAAGIGSGADNITAKEISIGADARIEAYSDGTKFAIDSRDGQADINVNGDILQSTFVKPYDDGKIHQDPTGLKSITVTNDKTDETVVLHGMLDGYRSFAVTVSEAGEYTVYTDEAGVGQGGGRYFGKGKTEVRDPERDGLSELTRYKVTNGELSDNYFLFPVKSVVVTKVVAAEEGLDKSKINTTCYFALWDREAGSYVQRNGKTWIESIDIVNGVPQSKAIFADVNDSPEGGYGVWEVDENGRDEGIIGMTFGSYELRLVRTQHGDTGDNDATISDTNWTDRISVINTYVPVPDPDPDPDPDPTPDEPFIPAEDIEDDDVPLALGSLSNQLGECFD